MRKFRLDVSPSGKALYIDIEIDKKRLKFASDLIEGRISGEEAIAKQREIRRNWKEWKSLYFTLPEDGIIVKS